jgi:hypothetical protein
MSRLPRFFAVAVAALVMAGGAVAGTLTLHPAGFGPQSYAAWKAMQGQPDFTGSADQSLYFQKMVPTMTFAAGVAVFKGVAGHPVSDLTGLGFDYRMDGHCGAGAPRFSLVIQPPSGPKQRVVFGCLAMLPAGAVTFCPPHAATVLLACMWVRKRVAVPDLEGLPAGTISSLAIIFDEGNDQGQGYVHLDNVFVELNGMPHCWTSASDNGNSGDQACPKTDEDGGPLLLSPIAAGPLDVLADPTADAEIAAALNDVAPSAPLASWTFYQTPLL